MAGGVVPVGAVGHDGGEHGFALPVGVVQVWVPKTYAARRYSWMTPPARSRRRIRK
jgi:hypothetical protein